MRGIRLEGVFHKLTIFSELWTKVINTYACMCISVGVYGRVTKRKFESKFDLNGTRLVYFFTS